VSTCFMAFSYCLSLRPLVPKINLMGRYSPDSTVARPSYPPGLAGAFFFSMAATSANLRVSPPPPSLSTAECQSCLTRATGLDTFSQNQSRRPHIRGTFLAEKGNMLVRFFTKTTSKRAPRLRNPAMSEVALSPQGHPTGSLSFQSHGGLIGFGPET